MEDISIPFYFGWDAQYVLLIFGAQFVDVIYIQVNKCCVSDKKFIKLDNIILYIHTLLTIAIVNCSNIR